MRSNEICTRVVRQVIWWDVIGRVKSTRVGSSRYKSGQSGRYFFRAFFCCYAFASVFPLLESVPGSGKFSTTYADARLTPVTWRLGAECRVWTVNVGSGRSKSIQVDPGRGVFFFLAFVWLDLGVDGHWPVVAVMWVVLGVLYHGFGGVFGRFANCLFCDQFRGNWPGDGEGLCGAWEGGKAAEDKGGGLVDFGVSGEASEAESNGGVGLGGGEAEGTQDVRGFGDSGGASGAGGGGEVARWWKKAEEAICQENLIPNLA